MTDARAESVASRVAAVRARIDAAARAAGRPPDAVRLVAATKTQSVDAVRAVVAAGVTDLGENRAQELVAKAPELVASAPTWHFIGRLQRRNSYSVCSRRKQRVAVGRTGDLYSVLRWRFRFTGSHGLHWYCDRDAGNRGR